jgi:hypothetical protein
MRVARILVALSLLTIVVPADAQLGKVGEDTYRCTVAVGGGQTPAPAPNVGLDTAQSPVPLPERAALGGCQATSSLADSGIVTGIDAAEGCTAYADVAPTPGGEQPLAEDHPVKEGTGLWFHCEAGVVDAQNAITIDFGA